MQGLVSLVGVGPGDPGLLTLRGARAIARADAVLYDALVHPAVLRHARPEAERLYVGKRKGQDSTSQDEINHTLLLRARQGRRVARLKGGDPLLFARGAEEALFLAEHGVRCEIIPGVTAALGAAAYAGLALTHRELSSSVAFITATEHPSKAASAHAWQRLATCTQTLVIYMGMHRLAEDMAALVAHGRSGDTPAAAVQWATHPEQRVVSATVSTLAEACAREGLGAPALVVIGDAVALRDSLRWWDRGPLFGRRVAVTRSREQSEGFVEALVDEGATALEFPAIRFEGPSDEGPLASGIDGLREGLYTAVSFSSANGVERFFEGLASRSLDARCFGGALVAAVGPSTAEALRTKGLRPDCVAREHRGEGLAAALIEAIGDPARGARVLAVQAEVASDSLTFGLRGAGFEVDAVAAYRTVAADPEAMAPLRDELSDGTVDAVTFASGSAVTSVMAGIGSDAVELLASTTVATFGPVTSEAARAAGLTVSVEAKVPTVEGLLEALRDHFRRESPSP